MKRHMATLILALMLAVTAGVVSSLVASETPRGRVAGTLLTAETGLPLAKIDVELVENGNGDAMYTTTTDSAGRFAFRHVPVGEYRLVAKTQAHQQPDQTITVKEGKVSEAVYELEPTAPFLRLFQNQRMFTTSEKVRFRCHGFAPVDRLDVAVYRVSPKAAAERWQGWLPGMLTLRGQDIRQANLRDIPELSPTKTLQVEATHRDAEGVFREEISLGTLPPGMYLVSVSAEKVRELAVAAVTDLALITKAAPGELLAYAVNIDTGKPAVGATVELLQEGKRIGQGQVGADGLLSLRLPKTDDYSEIAVVGRLGESMAIANLYTYWNEDGDSLRAYTYTDRPVYRPGHHVSFKSILRELHGEEYRVPKRLTANIRVTDGKGTTIYTGEHTTSAFGSLAGDFTLNENAIPGYYTITILANGGSYESNFSVAEYRKPEFEVKVTPARKRYSRGETINATIDAQYFYGAPVPNAKIDYYVTRSSYWYYEGGDEWDVDLMEYESYGDYDYGEGEIVASGEGKTDDAGRLAITIPPVKEKKQATAADFDEPEDWRYTIHATVTDDSGRGEEGSGGVLVTQGEIRLTTTVEDWVTAPGEKTTVTITATDYQGRPVPGATGNLLFARQTWERDRVRLHNSTLQSWTADKDGKATLTVSPKRDGDYRVRATTTDRRGNRISASTWLWVMSDEYASFDYPYQDLDVQTDRNLYKEGDTAQVIVNTKFAPQTALLTIEGQRILEHRLVKLEGKSTIIKVPVRAGFLPSVRASVSFFSGKKYLSGEAMINVSREKKALRVEVTADKPTYEPGKPAVYTVQVRTPEGKPAQAEVSLGVVDEAIYAIAPDDTENIVSFFYPKRYPNVRTAFSFPEVYLSGDDKAGSTIRTRRFFPDTAFWRPTAVTGADGKATFELTMPDNLTTWRATCRAVTAETRVGQATSKAIVSKPFLVRLETPRFFTQGDKVTIAAVAHNLTKEAVTATVGMEAKGLKVLGDSVSARIEPGKTRRLEWTVEAPTVGNAVVRTWAKAGVLTDAMELTLPVQPKGRERMVLRSGSAVEGDSFRMEARRDAIPGTTALTIRLTPSLTSAMLGSLEYLASYPYGCVEQTMSSFLPDVMIMRMLNEAGIENPDLKKKLPKMVDAGLLKLYDFQHDDGGWGWWRYDSTDPWMTAYVVYGLLQARQAGFAVTPHILDNGISALEQIAQNTTPETRAYAAYVLALAGRQETASTLLKSFRDSQEGTVTAMGMGDWSGAMLAQALHALGRDDEARRVLEDIWGRFSGGQFTQQTGERWWSEVDAAAALLAAACELTPEDPRLPELVRWLLERRREDRWYSTRDTAFALYGLVRYLNITRELTPNMTVSVNVNGRSVASRHFTAADVFKPEVEVVCVPEDLKDGKVSVELKKSGEGRLYYTATLRQYITSDLGQPVRSHAGLVVERKYHVLPPPGKKDNWREDAPSQTTFKVGDIIEAHLTLRSQRTFQYVMVEDMLPAGCEAVDRGPVYPWEWNYWWCEQVVRDEKVGFALRELGPGKQQIIYRMRAVTPGSFTALPPQIYDMYNPLARGEGKADEVVIRK